jgi:FixJ family two-component response regulator
LIAVVDDDDSLRVAVAGLVRSLGHRAKDYPSAEAFLADVATETADLLVTDIQMSGLNGIELIEQLAASGRRIPAIVITARAEPAVREKALAAGALCVMLKPFAAEDLVACLERTLTLKD